MHRIDVTNNCPVCNNLVNTYYLEGDGRVIACFSCGYHHSKIRVRTHPNYEEDLGRWKFHTTYNPWGHAAIIFNKSSGKDTLNTAIDNEYLDDFLHTMVREKKSIKAILVSYFKDNKINVVNLLEYL